MFKVTSTPNAPAAIGPYSQAICANGILFASGQIALDPATGEVCGTTIGAGRALLPERQRHSGGQRPDL